MYYPLYNIRASVDKHLTTCLYARLLYIYHSIQGHHIARIKCCRFADYCLSSIKI